MHRVIALLIALAVLPAAAQDVTGLWKAKRTFGPEVGGTLTIDREGDAWRAEIAGRSAAVTVEKDRLSFALPNDEGSFRGRLRNDRIEGHWMQSRTMTVGAVFALPVTLTKLRANRWRGVVESVPDAFTLYLPITKNADGTFAAFLKNPERNFGMFQRVQTLTLDGTKVRLEGPRGLVAEGQYADDRLAIDIPNRGGWFDFARATPADESRFYPRAKTPPAVSYRKPSVEDDGWPVSTPEEVGLSREELVKLVQHLVALPVDSLRAQEVHAILVARHGKLVVEEYFHGSHREELHDLRSAAKVLATFLAGAAKLPASTKVYEAMHAQTSDPRAQAMTLEHLLTMSSGLDCDDADEKSPGREDTMWEQEAQPDFYRFTLDLKMIREPGAKSVYCSVQPNLAGGVVASATGRWLPELFRESVAEPMQIHRYALGLIPTGQAYLGGGSRMTARDFLKLAQVTMDGGKWRGKQIISSEWAKRATAPLSTIGTQQYGYLWWLLDLPFRGRTVRAFYAAGNGGQTSMAIPELDLSIVIFGGNYADGAATLATQRELVPQWVLPAVR